MTTYTTISNALVQVGAKPFSTTVTALRDNPIAIGEADASVPLNLLPTVLLGTITTTSGTSQSLSSLTLTPFKFLKVVFVGMSATGAVSFALNGGAVAVSGAASDAFSGIVQIDLVDGTYSANLSSGGASTTYAGDTTLSNASTTVTVSITAGVGNFDAGLVRVYGVK